MSLYQDDMCLLSGPPSSSGASISSKKTPIPRSVYPVTKSQEGMWVEFQTDPLSTKYNLTLEWDLLRNSTGERPSVTAVLQGKLIDCIDYSGRFFNFLTVIRKITARHATLRSMFAVVDGKPHLEEYSADDVDPDVRIVYREESGVTEGAMTQILRRPFALQQELPARWVILQDSKAFRVYIVGHHIVVDGQSMTNISGEFMELLENPDAVLPPVVGFSTMHMTEVS